VLDVTLIWRRLLDQTGRSEWLAKEVADKGNVGARLSENVSRAYPSGLSPPTQYFPSPDVPTLAVYLGTTMAGQSKKRGASEP
jgi:hypothetical protein